LLGIGVKLRKAHSFFLHAIPRPSNLTRSLSTEVHIARLEHSGTMSVKFVAAVNDVLIVFTFYFGYFARHYEEECVTFLLQATHA
jgi:hypothetical protein